jgi:hypothetical protein
MAKSRSPSLPCALDESDLVSSTTGLRGFYIDKRLDREREREREILRKKDVESEGNACACASASVVESDGDRICRWRR